MSSSFLILAGTFSGTISTLNFTTSPYSLSFVTNTSIGTAPSWLLGNPNNSSIFYATDEAENGAINSFTVDHVTGQVTHVSSISTQANGPTHLGLVRNGSQIGAANYGGNSSFFASLSEDQLHFSNPQLLLLNETSNSNPHEIVAFNDQVLVSDLGADRVWRLVQDGSSNWSVQDYISQPTGSGPRHIVVDDGSLYVLHELANTLTQQSISSSSTTAQPSTISTVSIIPSGTPDDVTSQFHAGELLFAQSPSPLLYASNRDDPNNNDTIVVVEINPLNKVMDIGTGLQELRGVAFIGENDAYLIAGGMKDGGIKVYERVSASEGYLKEVASLPAGLVSQPSSFIWVPPQDADSTINSSGTTTTTILPTQLHSGARRRYRFGI